MQAGCSLIWGCVKTTKVEEKTPGNGQGLSLACCLRFWHLHSLASVIWIFSDLFMHSLKIFMI